MMQTPDPVIGWLENNGFGHITSIQLVGGGCINRGARLLTSSGETFFLKTNTTTPEDMFTREAEGLIELNVGDGPGVPQPFSHGPTFLLMEDLSPAPRRQDYWQEFGRKLAKLHQHTKPVFGFGGDNYIGSTTQPNDYHADGFVFFAVNRLQFQAQLANRQGLLDSTNLTRILTLARKLPELVPVQPASLIHGDLWSGNAVTDRTGGPAIIDPAAYYGWAEAELAMTALFGGFQPQFYESYREIHPLEKGWRDRFDIYNLYHLINHLNLFGSSYLSQVQAVLRRYT